jgi:hypothetical protein
MAHLDEVAAMRAGGEVTGRVLPALWREVCDKCGTRMELKGCTEPMTLGGWSGRRSRMAPH